MGAKVVHFEVVGSDRNTLSAFYSSLFDWKIEPYGEMDYGTVPAEDAGIGGGICGGNEEMSFTIFYVQVEDINATLKRVEEMGGTVVVPRTEVAGIVIFAHFKDPEGHLIGLVE